MAVTQEMAQAAIEARMEANGAEIERLEVVPKGRGVWMALARIKGTDVERQGIFTDQELEDSTP